MSGSWKKINEHYGYQGWRQIIIRQFILPDGREAAFDIIGNGPYVTVAAFTPEREAILMRQFRPGPEKELVSFCEGYIDAEETPEAAARRELLEETGYEADTFIPLKEKRSAYATDHQYFLLATNCKKVAVQQLEAYEFIEVFTVPLPQFRQFIREAKDPHFTNIDGAYLALDYLGWL